MVTDGERDYFIVAFETVRFSVQSSVDDGCGLPSQGLHGVHR